MEYLFIIFKSLNINVQTLVSYATINQLQHGRQKPAKNPMQKLPKNPSKNLLKIFCAPKSPKITQKTFNISFTKNPIKILNNNKKPLILQNKHQKTYEPA